MHHIPQLITDLAVILGVAAIVTYVFKKINQPVVLGYIVAGIIVGPYTHPIFSIVDVSSVTTWAELGVIFLMFALGLEFSFRRLVKVGVSAGVTAIVQIFVMLGLGISVAELLGWPHMDAVFLGCMIAISSTTIIIKALEELGLKNKRFSELVFGILIVEDLAAILMLVALTNISLTSSIGGLELLIAGGKLAIVVGVWFLVGIFIVPRFVKKVSQQKNNEMLVVVAIGLCLSLVALAAYLDYSVALGAFVMGSIIAETPEAKNIEHLVQPLKDIFGAVFFVSVGMLLDPNTIYNNFSTILLISLTIIFGKLISVSFGALVTGQTLPNSIQTGFSMAQIGEFSFIIAALGLSFNVIDTKLYPIIVTASIITTFTTPYLIRYSTNVSTYIDKSMPIRLKNNINNYTNWFQRVSIINDKQKTLNKKALKWTLNLVVVIAVFILTSEKLYPLIYNYMENTYIAKILSIFSAFVLSSPSIWAMLNIFQTPIKIHAKNIVTIDILLLLISRTLTIFIVGLLSLRFFPSFITVAVTLSIAILFLLLISKRVGKYYSWFEMQFAASLQQDEKSNSNQTIQEQLAPWDAHLIEIEVPAYSFITGKTLEELQIRKTYGVNLVAIKRGENTIVSPEIHERFYPSDVLLCFSTDQEIDTFKNDLEASSKINLKTESVQEFKLQRFIVKNDSYLNGISIKDAAVNIKYGSIIVGIERENDRIKNPNANTILKENDILWIVGGLKSLTEFANEF